MWRKKKGGRVWRERDSEKEKGRQEKAGNRIGL